jgi:hypothetical protein
MIAGATSQKKWVNFRSTRPMILKRGLGMARPRPHRASALAPAPTCSQAPSSSGPEVDPLLDGGPQLSELARQGHEWMGDESKLDYAPILAIIGLAEAVLAVAHEIRETFAPCRTGDLVPTSPPIGREEPSMTDYDYGRELEAASKKAWMNAEIAESYLGAAHDEADLAKASSKAQIGIGYALLAIVHEVRAHSDVTKGR